MAELIWITVAVVQVIHDDQIAAHGGAYGLRDEGLLMSALARSRHRYDYEATNLHRLAADYGFGIARNHPFIDGNKRTAFLVMYVFLKVLHLGVSLGQDKGSCLAPRTRCLRPTVLISA